MDQNSFRLFYLLKKEIEKTFKEEHSYCNKDIHNWTGQEILDLQDDLQKKVNGRISEKWFYTHVKTENNKKLPRIDVLNLLAKYCGYLNWDDFININREKNDIQNKLSGKKKNNKKKVSIILTSLLILSIILFYSLKERNDINTYEFCFIDDDFGTPINNTKIDIQVLNETETPLQLNSDSCGCINIRTDEDIVRFIVKADYYHTDTIIRSYNSTKNTEFINFKKDDYALMIHAFSRSGVESWEKRRKQLDDMISEEAKVFQLDYYSNLGMQMYTKWEFIDKLTTPLKSLKDIDIIDTKYKNKRIIMLRFVQKSDEL